MLSQSPTSVPAVSPQRSDDASEDLELPLALKCPHLGPDDTQEHQMEGSSTHTASSQVDHFVVSDHDTSHIDASDTMEPHQEQEPTESSTTPLCSSGRLAMVTAAMEHRLLLRAALALLAERDRHAPEVGMLDPVVLKAGSLKKAAHLVNGVWKPKYVEIRRGMFSYYHNEKRKNIPLEAAHCTCRPVKLHQKALNFNYSGALFELTLYQSKRLWMARSREERHSWMQAIHHAMVGGSVTRGEDTQTRRAPRQFTKIQNSLRNAKSCTEYMQGLNELTKRSLVVPVNVVQAEASSTAQFREETIDMSVDQLWRDLQRDCVRIDGVTYKGDEPHGPDRIVAALTQRIWHVSRSTPTAQSLSESQALALARDALLAGNRTRTGGDSYFCTNALCKNEELLVIVPSAQEAEPVTFEVTEDQSEQAFHTRLSGKTGWIKTRNMINRVWKRRYFVLSEGTLSYYEGADPRPHGFKGQLMLKDAALSVKRKDHDKATFTISITVNEGTAPLRETLLLLETNDQLVDWTFALECATRFKILAQSRRLLLRRRSNAKEQDIPTVASFTDLVTQSQQATLEIAAQLGLDGQLVAARLEKSSRQTNAAIQISLRACQEYKICTTDPQGDEELDTWATVRTHFLQTMRMTGGSNVRITRGEETVRISVIDSINVTDQQEIHEPPASPSRRQRPGIRLFRGSSTSNDELNELRINEALSQTPTAS